MATVVKICQGAFPGRQLVMITGRAASIEHPPAGGSRGTEAAMTQRPQENVADDCDGNKRSK